MKSKIVYTYFLTTLKSSLKIRQVQQEKSQLFKILSNISCEKK